MIHEVTPSVMRNNPTPAEAQELQNGHPNGGPSARVSTIN